MSHEEDRAIMVGFASLMACLMMVVALLCAGIAAWAGWFERTVSLSALAVASAGCWLLVDWIRAR